MAMKQFKKYMRTYDVVTNLHGSCDFDRLWFSVPYEVREQLSSRQLAEMLDSFIDCCITKRLDPRPVLKVTEIKNA